MRESVATKADVREAKLRLEAKIETTAANLRADIAVGFSRPLSRSAASFSPPSNS